MIGRDSNTYFAKGADVDVATVRRVRVTDLMQVDAPEGATQQERDDAAKCIRSLRRYFRVFAHVPTDGNFAAGGQKCLGCGEWLGGMLGTFTWGLAHGEGHCRKCGWPSRAMHYPKDEAGEDILSLRNYVLQYHPDEVRP